MTCEELNGLLDQLMDGELSDGQRRAMYAHGANCPDCAAAIRSAEQLKALFDEMEPEVDVPLEAQARWRSAVRAESKRRNGKRLYRWIASAAAAVVVLVGVSLAVNLRGAPKQAQNEALIVAEQAAELDEAGYDAAYEADEAAPAEAELAPNAAAVARGAGDVAEDYDVAGSAVVETDGAADTAVANSLAMAIVEEEACEEFASEDAGAEGLAAKAQPAPACELSLDVEDVDTACSRILDLVEEYEGSADVQALAEGGANVYVEIESNNAKDFINAVAPLDTSGQTHALPDFSEAGTVLVLLAVKA